MDGAASGAGAADAGETSSIADASRSDSEVGTDAGSAPPAPFAATYFIGTDISRVQTDPPATLYTDNDGTQKDLLVLLKGHGFNYIRVRTFADPRAADGNSKTAGFYDIPHTVTFGKRIKDASMGFLLDFHYSDNWADPGKQCVPIAWQGFTTIADLATAVHDYTKDAITGAVSNWNNLGALLRAAAQGIKDVDTGIKIMIHLDKAQDFATSRAFITNAIAQKVPFDVFGESSYTLYQGPPSGWQSTFTQLAAAFPNLKFVSAEYGPDERAINDIIFGLPNQQGIGTFYWEATHSGADNAGALLFSNRAAQPDLLLYDAMKTAYASRL